MANILIIDDEPSSVESHAQGLRAAGQTVLTAHFSKDIVFKTLRLIVVDVHMPVLDGFQVVGQIRADVQNKNIPVLFITSDTTSKTIGRCLGYANSDYIHKNSSTAEFVARALRLLAGGEQESILRFGKLQVVPSKAIAQAGNQTLELTSKEFKILLAVLTLGHPLTREDLIEFVWGSVSVTDKTLNSHLTNLRAKLSVAQVGLSVTREGHVSIFEQT